MEALELSLKSFESVSGWRRKVNQRFSIIQDVELPGSNFLDTGPPNTLAESALFEEPFNRRISEALDSHTPLYHDKVYLIKVFLYQVVKEGPDSRIGNYCRHDPSPSDPGGVGAGGDERALEGAEIEISAHDAGAIAAQGAG